MQHPLPREKIVEIILKSSYKQIKGFCRANKVYKKICEDDYVWKKLLKRDYSYFTDEALDEMEFLGDTYRDKYDNIHSHIKDFADKLTDKYKLTNPKYSNRTAMYEDIIKILNDIVDFLINDENIFDDGNLNLEYIYDNNYEAGGSILLILSGLKERYVGEEDGQLVFEKVGGLNTEIVNDLDEFSTYFLPELMA